MHPGRQGTDGVAFSGGRATTADNAGDDPGHDQDDRDDQGPRGGFDEQPDASEHEGQEEQNDEKGHENSLSVRHAMVGMFISCWYPEPRLTKPVCAATPRAPIRILSAVYRRSSRGEERGERGEVTVIARWLDPSSYQALRESPQFQSTMARFAEDFTEPPWESINEILVEM